MNDLPAHGPIPEGGPKVSPAATVLIFRRERGESLEPRLGVASCPADGELAEQVLGRAAQAAHAARESGAVMARFDLAPFEQDHGQTLGV